MPVIGIDLGTSNSLVSVWRETSAELVPNALGSVLTPSAVSIAEDGSVLVGQAALDRIVCAPECSASGFKRFMGTDKKYFLGGQTFAPEDLSALVLRKLKDDAGQWLGEDVSEAVISVPAYFNDAQRAATKAAGRLAGLRVERILNEPSAAALTCRLYDQSTDMKALIFDFGGGTLDVSIVDCFENMLSVMAVSGDNQLGGRDFDRQIALGYCEANGLDLDLLSPLAQADLLQRAEACKRELSNKKETLLHIAAGEAAGKLELTNQKLIDMSGPLFQRMGTPVRRVLADSKTRLREISHIVLVGGSCNMPVVQAFLSRLLRREVGHPFSPDTVVGLGLGIYAGIKERREEVRDIIMTDICPFTLGTSVVGSKEDDTLHMASIIERNSPLPCSRVKKFWTTTANQTKVRIDILQGEGFYSKDNLLLGEMTLNVPPAPEGKECVSVRFTYDINGLLEVEGTVPSTGEVRREILLGKRSGMTEEEARQRMQALAALKRPPHEEEEARALLAWGERLYAQTTGEERTAVVIAVEDFLKACAAGGPVALARGKKVFREVLERVEKFSAGYGLLPSDDTDDADAFDVGDNDAADAEPEGMGPPPSGSVLQ